MRWWTDGLFRRWGRDGALENVRVELERRRMSLERAEALARRVTPPREDSQARRRRSVA